MTQVLPVPPEDLRSWVGPFADPETFLRSGRETVALLRSLCGLQPDHTILDVGCGSGRVALGLIGYLTPPGRYIGFDPARAPIEWCRAQIASRHPQFEFLHVDVRNASYHPEGQWSAETVRFPAESGSTHVALLSSVFTHLLPDEVKAYTGELSRILRPGGRCLISYLLMNGEAQAAVRAGTTIFDLQYRHGPFVTFSRDDPTEGLAYDEPYALATLQDAGLEVETIRYGTWRDVHSYEVEHDWVVARKPSSAARRHAGHAAPANARCSPPRRNRAGAPHINDAESDQKNDEEPGTRRTDTARLAVRVPASSGGTAEMIKVSVLYPGGTGTEFDMGYYLSRHIPMVRAKLGAACKNAAVEQGLGGATPGAPPPFTAMGHLYFDSVEAFQAAFGPHADAIMADIPNYTNVQPTIQVSEVKL